MKKILFIISLLAICTGLNAQTTKKDVRPEVLIETTMGNIRVELYNETPLHRDNFLKLIREHHYYDSLLFHRVIPDFMIQGGDPYSKNAPKGAVLGDHSLDYKIPAEICLPQIFHKRGALAAAREPDEVNPKRESSSTQFYIVYGKKQDEKGLQRGRDNLHKLFGDSIKMTKEMEEQYTTVGGTPHLDGGYTVFGQVTEGMDVVDRIQHVECDANNRPLEDVRIIKATILRDLPGMEKKPKKVVRRVAKKTDMSHLSRGATTCRKDSKKQLSKCSSSVLTSYKRRRNLLALQQCLLPSMTIHIDFVTKRKPNHQEATV